jgi:hypothetical protein
VFSVEDEQIYPFVEHGAKRERPWLQATLTDGSPGSNLTYQNSKVLCNLKNSWIGYSLWRKTWISRRYLMIGEFLWWQLSLGEELLGGGNY